MGQLNDGLVDSPQHIFSAEPIEDDFDDKGKKKSFEWKKDLSSIDGVIATAKYGKRTYNVTVDKVRVSVLTDPHKSSVEVKKEIEVEKPTFFQVKESKPEPRVDVKHHEAEVSTQRMIEKESKPTPKWDFTYNKKSKK